MFRQSIPDVLADANDTYLLVLLIGQTYTINEQKLIRINNETIIYEQLHDVCVCVARKSLFVFGVYPAGERVVVGRYGRGGHQPGFVR